jgi:hypothetical protein
MARPRRSTACASAGIVAGIAAAVAYRARVRPWLIRWGATDDEVGGVLPGDELVERSGPRTTRAISVAAPPDAVWPWLVQIGEDRAGFYSYAWLERLAGCHMHNASSIHPEWQRVEVGDTVWLARRYGELGRQVVAVLEPERAFVMVSPADFEAIGEHRPASGSWGFFLAPTPDGGTRLLARGSGGAVGTFVFDVAHFVMEQKMMRAIKARAESSAAAQPMSTTQPKPLSRRNSDMRAVTVGN